MDTFLTIFRTFFFSSYFLFLVPRRVRSPSFLLYFKYNIGSMPGFEPEMLRQQPGVPPMSYTLMKFNINRLFSETQTVYAKIYIISGILVLVLIFY